VAGVGGRAGSGRSGAAGRVGASRFTLAAVERLDDNVDKLVVFAGAVLGGVAELREAAFCFSGLA
jgi:hypothetical protein